MKVAAESSVVDESEGPLRAKRVFVIAHRILCQGSLKDTCFQLETWLFPPKLTGKPPFTRQCSGV